jgi:predicted Zn-dependent protease
MAEALDVAERFRAGIGPDQPLGDVAVAVALLESGRATEAARIFARVGKELAGRDSSPSSARHAAWQLTHAGVARARAGDFTSLGALADSIERIGARSGYGRDPRLHFHLRGLVAMHEGRTADGIDAFRRATFSTSHGYTQTNLELGRALLEAGRPEEAVRAIAPGLRSSLESTAFYLSRTELQELLARAHERAGRSAGRAGPDRGRRGTHVLTAPGPCGGQRTTLKLHIGVPSAPSRRTQSGSSISVPRDVVMSPRSITSFQPNHSCSQRVT